MIKCFCDRCGDEITEARRKRSVFVDHGLSIIVDFRRERPSIQFPDWCNYCLLDRLAELDDRPKQSSQ